MNESTLCKKEPDWLVNGKPPKILENLATDEAEKERIKRVVQTNLVHEENNQLCLSAAIDVNRFSQDIKLYRVVIIYFIYSWMLIVYINK